MKKLKEILLVDDSRGTNVLNERLLSSMGVSQKITAVLNGQEALDYLTKPNQNGEFPNPELVFLDINMPVMDGYQFLEKYEMLDTRYRAFKVIIMLTTSISHEDQDKVKKYPAVKEYLFKPLTKQHVNSILEEFL